MSRSSGQAEDDLGGDDEGGQPDGVDLRAVDARAARLDRPVDRVQRPAERGRADRAQPLGQLARGAAGHVGLGRARVVDHLPLRQMARGEQGAGLRHRGGEREVARRDGARAALAGPRVDRREVLAGQAGRADDHVHAALERGVRVAPAASCDVKSISTSTPSSASATAPYTGTPSGARPSASPRSLPAAARATALRSSRSSAARMPSASARPVQPVAPARQMAITGGPGAGGRAAARARRCAPRARPAGRAGPAERDARPRPWTGSAAGPRRFPRLAAGGAAGGRSTSAGAPRPPRERSLAGAPSPAAASRRVRGDAPSRARCDLGRALALRDDVRGPGAGGRLVGGQPAARRSPGQALLQAGRELAQQPVGDVLDHPAAAEATRAGP